MNLLEDDIRTTLRTESRRVAAPADVTGWIGGEVRRQRRRNAVVGAVLAIGATVAVSLVVLPLLGGDGEATYVAGAPDEGSGLLPWEPVGPLPGTFSEVEAAVAAWHDQVQEGIGGGPRGATWRHRE